MFKMPLFGKTVLAGVFLLSFAGSVFAQVIVRGVVIDASTNEPVAGASVFQKGTTNGVVTSSDGEFEMVVREEGVTLKVRFVGYKTTEVPAKSKGKMRISLPADE